MLLFLLTPFDLLLQDPGSARNWDSAWVWSQSKELAKRKNCDSYLRQKGGCPMNHWRGEVKGATLTTCDRKKGPGNFGFFTHPKIDSNYKTPNLT